jgi:2-methylcitrate dehydratase PrpD
MGAMLHLLKSNDIGPADIKSIRVGTNRHMPNALIHHQPKDHLTAKFSMEFCMAILVIERRAGLAEFTDDVVNRDDVQDLIKRVEFVADPEADEGGFREMTSLITVELTDGRTLRARAEFGKGSPANPMTDAELIDKFLGCLDWAGMPESVGHEVAGRVLALEEEPRLRPLLALLHSTTLAGAR